MEQKRRFPTWGKWLIGCSALVVVLAVAGVAVLATWVSGQPRDWNADASLEVDCSPDEVQALLVDLRRWPEWSAWTRDADEEISRTYEGSESGVGARMRWMSTRMEIGGGAVRINAGPSSDAGVGSMEITAVEAGRVAIETRFDGELKLARSERDGNSTSSGTLVIGDLDRDYVVRGEITLEPLGERTRVTWIEHSTFGDGFAAGLVATGVRPMVEEAHSGILEASLRGLARKLEESK